MDSQPAQLGTGQEIGRHVVLRPLARGGMAELFLVRTTGLKGFEKIVALKRILPQFAGDPEFVKMFLDEARLAAKLDHPNIAHVYDIGRDGSDYFFTMEYVHGEDLRNLMKCASAGTGFPLSFAAAIAAGVSAGLHHAHSRVGYDGQPLGLVHRDVSPTNVLISYDGAVKVVDFGVAKAAASSHVTTEGTRKGKFAYMSPEQCRAEPVDPRSDVFAIGILLYEMCTLARAFRGDNEFATMRQIVEGNFVPPSEARPDIPPELERIIMKAMATEPSDRYETARDLQLDLEILARDNKWTTSPAALGDFVREAFGPKPFPWEGVEGMGDVVAQPDGSFVTASEGTPTKKKPMPFSVVALPETTAVETTPSRRRAPWLLGVLGVAAVAGVGAVATQLPDAAQPGPGVSKPTAGPPRAAATAPQREPAPVPKSEPESEPAPEPEAAPEPEPVPEPEAVPEEDPEHRPERAAESDPEPTPAKPTPKRRPKAKKPRAEKREAGTPKAAPKPEPKPKAKPKPKPKGDEPVLWPI